MREVLIVRLHCMGVWQPVPDIKVDIVQKVADLTSELQTLLIVKSLRCLAY